MTAATHANNRRPPSQPGRADQPIRHSTKAAAPGDTLTAKIEPEQSLAERPTAALTPINRRRSASGHVRRGRFRPLADVFAQASTWPELSALRQERTLAGSPKADARALANSERTSFATGLVGRRWVGIGRRGGAGDSASAPAYGGANRRAWPTDWKSHDTADGGAERCAGRATP